MHLIILDFLHYLGPIIDKMPDISLFLNLECKYSRELFEIFLQFE